MFRIRKLINDGISLKSLYFWVVFIAVLFTVLVAYSTVNLSKSFRVLSSSVEEHKFLETSAIKMIDGSDYLTERVQRYAVTGEADYVSDYLTEALQTQRREQAIRDLTRDPRCSTALELLNLAMAASQHLMEREYYAMKLVASAKNQENILNTLSGIDEDKRIPKAQHTREIIIPLARRVHAYYFVDELEELCFQTEHPRKYEMITKQYRALRAVNSRMCHESLDKLSSIFDPHYNHETRDLDRWHRDIVNFTYRHRSCVSIYRQISHDADNINDDWSRLLSKDRVALYELTLIVRDELNDDDSGTFRFLDISEVHLLPVKENLTAVRTIRIDTGKDFHKCGLSCSVLSADRMNRTLANLKRYIVESFDTRELLCDPFHLKN